MSTENIKADIIEARSITVKYNTNIGEGGGITINNLNVEEEIKQNKLRNQTLENVIDNHINDAESENRKHILPEEIETINETKTQVETLKGQIEELDNKVDDISESIDKPEIQAHKVSIVANEEEPGILTVNGANIADKIESVESDISILQNKVDAHTHDVGRVVYDENRIHLTQGDITKINSVESKAEKSKVAELETSITELTEIVNTKANETDLNNLAANCVTYEPRAGYNAITKENLVFTKDLGFKNAQITMHNNGIYLLNDCANIEGLNSYIKIKDAKVSNIVEVQGTMGDVTLDRNGEWYSVWDHLTNKVKHITKEERDRWNAKTDRTIFVLADGDEDGKPVVETPNTTYIYLVEDPHAKEGSDFHYNKWAWVERKDIPEEYAWEQIGSPALELEPSANDDITDESVIEDYVVKHNFTLNKIEEIKNNEESQLAPTTSAVVEFVGDELEKYVNRAGDTMYGDLLVTDDESGAVLIQNTGNIVSTQSVTTGTNFTRFILPIYDEELGKNLEIDIAEYATDTINLHGNVSVKDRIMTNWVTPNTGNTITFYNVNSEGTAAENVTVTVSNGPVSNKHIKMVSGPEIPSEIYISNGDSEYGEVGVYDHITNPHVHLTEKQLDILNAAEKGCFAYGPVKPDPEHEDDPYKFRNPKVLLTHKDSWSDGQGEISLQVGTTNEAYIELVNTDRITNTISISSGYDNGNSLDVTDEGITIKTANPRSAVQNAPLNVMGDTAIGNNDTNYKFTVNGVDITPDKKQVDTKNNEDYVDAGNANGAMCVIEPLSNTDDVTLKSLTFTTRSGTPGKVPDGKKMALYCCNADEAPSPFKSNAPADAKHELPTGWKYIGISKNSYSAMAFNTKYKYEFDDIKIEKGMMIAISFTDFEDLTENQFAWTEFGIKGRVNKTPEDRKNTFYNNSLSAGTTTKSGVTYRYTIEYTAEFVKDHTAKPITDTETPILYDGSIYNVTGDSITVIATDIRNQVAKSTIVFIPTADVSINNLFTGPIDKTICYEETLLQGKVSIIEITHLNVNDTNYITATITPNIK